MSSAGCSATPLARKLGVKPQSNVMVQGAPDGWQIPGLPEGASVVRTAKKADVVVAFFRHSAELSARVAKLAQVVRPNGALWLAWPRRAGGHDSDVTDNVVRQIVLPLGLVDVKVAALDQDWSGLKFVWRKELRK